MRLIRKEVDKLRIKQIEETGGETCIACHEQTIKGNWGSSSESGSALLAVDPKTPIRCPKCGGVDALEKFIQIGTLDLKCPKCGYVSLPGEFNIVEEHGHGGNPNGLGEAVISGMAAGVGSVIGAKLLEGGSSSNPNNPEIPPYCEFVKEEVKPKGYFDKRSFRTICPESPTRLCKDLPPELACATRIIIGCRKGEFIKGRCRVGTEGHVIYHGSNPGNPASSSPQYEKLCDMIRKLIEKEKKAPDEYIELMSEIQKQVPGLRTAAFVEAFAAATVDDEEKHRKLLARLYGIFECRGSKSASSGEEDLEEVTIIHGPEGSSSGNPDTREVERELAERGIIF